MRTHRACLPGRQVLFSIVVLCLAGAGAAEAGTRADLSGDAIADFQATMDMPFMAVGNLANVDGPYDGGFGAVDYDYTIGKFEVTAGQYTEFLNAVAADDTYALFNERMADPAHIPGDLPFAGCNIQRSGPSGSYSYSVAADWEDRPVNYVSWGDVARFANWLTNDMPTGAQDLTTTEDGAYFLNGATSGADLKAAIAARNARPVEEAFYYMPTEDEWYKAAFHKNDGNTGNYFDYATSSNTTPSYIADGGSVTDPDPGNVAIYDGDGGVDGIGEPYYRTEVGEHENTDSPYGAFDMNGNVGEWTAGIQNAWGQEFTIVRSGEYAYGAGGLHADYRRIRGATRESGDIGFRLSRIGPPDAPRLSAGDFDGVDGVNNIDIDLLAEYIRTGMIPAGAAAGAEFDLSDNGTIDALDLDYLARFLVETSAVDGLGDPIEGTQYGDFNLDGLVNTTDLTILATNFGPNIPWALGNANTDVDINNTDLTIMATYFNFSNGGVDNIPEPMTLILMGCGAIGLLRRRRS